jgi:Fe2+ or Zn2+ uptake regulation protein
VKCGKVDEFTDEVIEDRQSQIAKDLGYDLTDHVQAILYHLGGLFSF